MPNSFDCIRYTPEKREGGGGASRTSLPLARGGGALGHQAPTEKLRGESRRSRREVWPKSRPERCSVASESDGDGGRSEALERRPERRPPDSVTTSAPDKGSTWPGAGVGGGRHARRARESEKVSRIDERRPVPRLDVAGRDENCWVRDASAVKGAAAKACFKENLIIFLASFVASVTPVRAIPHY